MAGGPKGQFDCIKAFSETDFTEDLKKFDVPTLIIHGDDDQIVPFEDSSRVSAKIIKGSILQVYPGGSHGLAVTHKDQLNKDLLDFVKTGKVSAPEKVENQIRRIF
jgi:non-heme chloroperoxidase